VSRPRCTVPWRPVDGIILLDKPLGLSSNKALQRVRHLLLAEKGGHTGSLDPLATGLLPLCFGEATKIAGLMLAGHKAYETTARLGAVTDTADADGEVLQQRPVPPLDAARVEHELQAFRGRILQRPPIYSALKQGGEPLYLKARRGEAVEVPEREAEVFRLDLLELGEGFLRLRIECGSGTYVRSLVADLGEALGCGAHVEALRRIWAEPFREPRMWTLDEIEALAGAGPNDLRAAMLPLEAGLAGVPAVELDEVLATRFNQGQRLRMAGMADAPQVAVFHANKAQGMALIEQGMLRPTRRFLHASDFGLG
jgi:tRNA pseudouridine55 synthase